MHRTSQIIFRMLNFGVLLSEIFQNHHYRHPMFSLFSEPIIFPQNIFRLTIRTNFHWHGWDKIQVESPGWKASFWMFSVNSFVYLLISIKSSTWPSAIGRTSAAAPITTSHTAATMQFCNTSWCCYSILVTPIDFSHQQPSPSAWPYNFTCSFMRYLHLLIRRFMQLNGQSMKMVFGMQRAIWLEATTTTVNGRVAAHINRMGCILSWNYPFVWGYGISAQQQYFEYRFKIRGESVSNITNEWLSEQIGVGRYME